MTPLPTAPAPLDHLPAKPFDSRQERRRDRAAGGFQQHPGHGSWARRPLFTVAGRVLQGRSTQGGRNTAYPAFPVPMPIGGMRHFAASAALLELATHPALPAFERRAEETRLRQCGFEAFSEVRGADPGSGFVDMQREYTGLRVGQLHAEARKACLVRLGRHANDGQAQRAGPVRDALEAESRICAEPRRAAAPARACRNRNMSTPATARR